MYNINKKDFVSLYILRIELYIKICIIIYVIKINKGDKTMYEVIKINCENGNETNYGTYTNEEDVKAIIKGYKFNGLFYTRANSKFFFMVTEK